MTLADYFESTAGIGVLSTAAADGSVNAALYSRPHVIDENTLAFIMADRRSHENLQSNGKAVYLFREGTQGYQGRRLYLEKIADEKNSPRIAALRRREAPAGPGDRYLVTFRITEQRPLTGSDEG